MSKKLYIRTTGVPINNLTNLIDSLYRTDGLPYDRTMLACATWLDEELTQIDCGRARRSFEDLLTLAQTYFPETTEKDLMGVLKELKIDFNFCKDIHKVVFYTCGANKLCRDDLRFWTTQSSLYYAPSTYTASQLLEIYNQL